MQGETTGNSPSTLIYTPHNRSIANPQQQTPLPGPFQHPKPRHTDPANTQDFPSLQNPASHNMSNEPNPIGQRLLARPPKNAINTIRLNQIKPVPRGHIDLLSTGTSSKGNVDIFSYLFSTGTSGWIDGGTTPLINGKSLCTHYHIIPKKHISETN